MILLSSVLTDSEVILCDTRSVLELIEQVELAHPEFPITDLIPTLLGSNDAQAPNEGSTPKTAYPRLKYDFPILQPTIPFFPPPIGWVGRHRDPPSTMFEAMRAGMWHNHWPGEARIQLDYSGVVSAYDEVYTSLVESQRGVPRSRHRLREMSTRDKEHLKSEVRSVLLRKQSRATVNWSALFQGFINRYGDRLEDLRRILRHSGRSPPETAALAREKVLIMLTPHMVLPRAQPHSPHGSSVPPSQVASNQAHLTQSRPDDNWIKRIYRSCSGSPTVAVLRSDKLTKQERLLAKSINTIQNEICYTLTNIWLTAFDFPDSPFLPQVLITSWKVQVEELMAWLDWSVWVKCDPPCNPGVRILSSFVPAKLNITLIIAVLYSLDLALGGSKRRPTCRPNLPRSRN